MAKDYDIGAAFEAIEEELIQSMMRNMKDHRVEEDGSKMQWEMWQAKQLDALEKYKKKNRKKYKDQFHKINSSIDRALNQAYVEGGMEQEIEILKAIKKRYGDNPTANARRIKDALAEKLPFGTRKQKDFFQVNDERLDALIHATTNDMKKAESAMLRMADDQYRKIIFNAQVYAATGAGTYDKAVDMATKDFLAAGINCIEYKDGRRVNIKSYARMAIRTADKRARLYADGKVRQKLGIHTVITKKRLNACPKCLPFVDKILIDDVWSGGTPEDGPYMLLSEAMAAGFLHPNCKDHFSTYMPGITDPPEGGFTEDEIREVEQGAKQEAAQKYAEYQSEKYGRLEKYSLDEDNQKQYKQKAEEWRNKAQKEYRFLTQDEYDQIVDDAQKIISREEKEHINGFDWENFRPANMEYGYINTENSFFINKAMREGKVLELPTESQKTIEHLKNVIKRSRISSNIKGRRYVDNDWLSSQLGEDADFDSIIAGKKIITDKQFVSCSLTDEVSYNTRDIEIIFDIPEGTNIYVTDNRMESEAIMYNPSYTIKGCNKKIVDDGRGGTKEQLQLICEVVDNG